MRHKLKGVLVAVLYALPLLPLWYAAAHGPEPARMGDFLVQHVECYRALLLPEWIVHTEFPVFDPDSGSAEADVVGGPEYLEGVVSFDTLQLVPSELKAFAAHEVAHLMQWKLGLLAERVDEERALEYQEEIATRLDRALRPLCPDTLTGVF
jgi:hypothetical protein